MNNKTILFFGATGSLGNKFIERNIENNNIVNFSRDECKHWKLEIKFQKYKNKITNILGNIRNKKRVKYAINKIKPNIIIIASALKHIDRCEYSTSESIDTNLIGIQNILDSIDELSANFKCESVIFISTDKACSPINVYGICKALSEKIMIEKAYNANHTKYAVVRYGNVLNSRGSIIPYLHAKGKDTNVKKLTLTDMRMTRFIMTLEESCKLIEYAINNANNGETIIPEIKSMKIKDLFEIFSKLYNKEIEIIGLRTGEKIHESLINGSQYMLTYKKNDYYHILPNYVKNINTSDQVDLNSSQNIISKEELEKYLIDLNLLIFPKNNDKYIS